MNSRNFFITSASTSGMATVFPVVSCIPFVNIAANTGERAAGWRLLQLFTRRACCGVAVTAVIYTASVLRGGGYCSYLHGERAAGRRLLQLFTRQAGTNLQGRTASDMISQYQGGPQVSVYHLNSSTCMWQPTMRSLNSSHRVVTTSQPRCQTPRFKYCWESVKVCWGCHRMGEGKNNPALYLNINKNPRCKPNAPLST